MTTPTFPPLLSGLSVSGATDPFDAAQAQAAMGCESGLIVYNLAASDLRAALVLVPEVPLADAMAMLPACGVGFQNALVRWPHPKWRCICNGRVASGSTAPPAAGCA